MMTAIERLIARILGKYPKFLLAKRLDPSYRENDIRAKFEYPDNRLTLRRGR